ncbi:MAG: hypothetical protein DELT_00511 [Desulfovibrio sp.]
MAGKLSYTFTLGASLASTFKGATRDARSQIRGISADVRTMEKSSTGKLGEAFTKSSAKLSGLTTELQQARTQLASLKSQAAAAGGANDLLARQIAQAESRVSKLTSSVKAATTSHRNLAATITTEAGSVGRLMNEYRGLTAQMDKARAKQRALSANLAARDANKSRRADLRGQMFDTVALAATVALPVKLAIDFESAMADAAKTIEGMRDDSGKLTPMYYAMVREAKLLGRELPLAHSQIASIMAAAGQQGMTDAKEIAQFTKDAAMMSVAFGMSNDDAAAAIGGYRTALGLAQDDVRDMLDLMNYFMQLLSPPLNPCTPRKNAKAGPCSLKKRGRYSLILQQMPPRLPRWWKNVTAGKQSQSLHRSLLLIIWPIALCTPNSLASNNACIRISMRWRQRRVLLPK